MHDFLTVKEVAKLFRAHPSAIRSAIKAGKIRAVRIGIGVRAPFRIPKLEIDRLQSMAWDDAMIGFKELSAFYEGDQ